MGWPESNPVGLRSPRRAIAAAHRWGSVGGHSSSGGRGGNGERSPIADNTYPPTVCDSPSRVPRRLDEAAQSRFCAEGNRGMLVEASLSTTDFCGSSRGLSPNACAEGRHSTPVPRESTGDHGRRTRDHSCRARGCARRPGRAPRRPAPGARMAAARRSLARTTALRSLVTRGLCSASSNGAPKGSSDALICRPTSGSSSTAARRPRLTLTHHMHRSCVSRGRGSCVRVMRSGAGWSATCTMVPSSGCSPSVWPSSSCGRTSLTGRAACCSERPRGSCRRRWPTCASSLGGSIRRCSPTRGWAPRYGCSGTRDCSSSDAGAALGRRDGRTRCRRPASQRARRLRHDGYRLDELVEIIEDVG